MVRLKDVGKIITGNTPKTSEKENYESNDICFVKPSDIESDGISYIEETENFIAECAREKARILPVNSVLVTCIGIIGKIGINKVECAFNQQINAIVPNEEICLAQYLAYAIKSKKFLLQDIANAPVVPILNKTQFADVEIKIVDLKEQESIVHKLAKVEALLEQRKQQLQKLDELVKARFVEMFGDLSSPECKWSAEKLVDVCVNSADIKCGPFGTQLSKDEYVSEGIAVWEIPQINSNFITKPTHFLTKTKAEQLETYSIKPGDIAMSRKGNVGKCAVFPEAFEGGIIHSDVLRIRVDVNQVLPKFLMYQLHYSSAVKHQIELVSAGAVMAGINVTKLKQIFVYVPPLKLQDKFADFVGQIDKSKLSVQKSLEKLETLKKALLQKYFG